MQDIESGYASLKIIDERLAEAVMGLINVCARTGTSSAGGYGISPLR